MRGWVERINDVCAGVTFAPPASEGELERAQAQLGVSIPTDLRGLLLESNGCHHPGLHLELVWSLDRVIEDTLRIRRELSQRGARDRSLVFFADAGNGDQFAIQIHQTPPVGTSYVVVWDHETNEIRQVADNLGEWLEGWLSGTITV